MRRVLVIKLGALGDFVLAMGPFAAIRRQPRREPQRLALVDISNRSKGVVVSTPREPDSSASC